MPKQKPLPIPLAPLDAEITDADDLFAEPRPVRSSPPPRLATITCRVCETPASVTVGSTGLLCDACRADPDAAAAQVERRQSAAFFAVQAAQEAFEEVLLHATPDDQARYWRLHALRALARLVERDGPLTAEGLIADMRDELTAADRAMLAEGLDAAGATRILRSVQRATTSADGLGRILRAERDRDIVVERNTAERAHVAAWATTALTEIAAAREADGKRGTR